MIWPKKFRFLERFVRSRDQLLQLSFIGRALPYPTPKVVEKSWRAHKLAYSTAAHCPQEVLDHAREFSERFFSSFRDEDKVLPLISPAWTEGACLEKTRAQGGLATYLHGQLTSDSALESRFRHAELISSGTD